MSHCDNNGSSFPSQAGAIGPAGPAGAAGAPGADGNTVLNGIVDPTTEGVDGDFFINTVTQEIFGPKAAGVWPAGISLLGATVLDSIQDPGIQVGITTAPLYPTTSLVTSPIAISSGTLRTNGDTMTVSIQVRRSNAGFIPTYKVLFGLTYDNSVTIPAGAGIIATVIKLKITRISTTRVNITQTVEPTGSYLSTNFASAGNAPLTWDVNDLDVGADNLLDIQGAVLPGAPPIIPAPDPTSVVELDDITVILNRR